MKPRLILLSDLWGQQRSNWWIFYTRLLQNQFEIQWYDSCELGQISLQPYEQECLHQQFVGGGIQRAARQLYELGHDIQVPRIVLSFSIGGTIAWKAIQEGLKVQQFYAVSATRLRYEQTPLSNKGCLFFGEKDAYSPSQDWYDQQTIQYKILPKQNHDCYQTLPVAEHIANEIRKAG